MHNAAMALVFLATFLLSPVMVGGFATGGPGKSTSVNEVKKKLPKIISFLDNAIKKINSDELLREIMTKDDIDSLKKAKSFMEAQLEIANSQSKRCTS